MNEMVEVLRDDIIYFYPRERYIDLHRHALFIYFDKKIAGLRVRTVLRTADIEINIDRLEQEFLSSDKIFTVK
jgi:hypothetical protein